MSDTISRDTEYPFVVASPKEIKKMSKGAIRNQIKRIERFNVNSEYVDTLKQELEVRFWNNFKPTDG